MFAIGPIIKVISTLIVVLMAVKRFKSYMDHEND